MITGPDVFERAKAAQQLAWAVRRLGYRALAGVVNYGLPVILAAANDPSPAVQRQGLWALHHLATGKRFCFPALKKLPLVPANHLLWTPYLAVDAQSAHGKRWLHRDICIQPGFSLGLWLAHPFLEAPWVCMYGVFSMTRPHSPLLWL